MTCALSARVEVTERNFQILHYGKDGRQPVDGNHFRISKPMACKAEQIGEFIRRAGPI